MNRSLTVLVAVLCAGCGSQAATWAQPNGDRSGTRSAHGASIDSGNVARLHVAWRFRIPVTPRESGVVTATPLAVGRVVYLQDMLSNVYAIDASSGALVWKHRLDAGTPGPNGLSFDRGLVYGSTDTTVFALDASTGRARWSHRILGRRESFVDIAPLAAHGLVYTATTGYGPGTRGALYALDERTGATRWRFDTIHGPWLHPDEAGGGGAWQTPTLAGGTLYVGTANPLPWGGSRGRPNGGAYPGAALWTDSLLALDAKTGALRWFDQVTPHDLRDHDFQNPPIVTGRLVVGSGKAGRVIAWDATTHRRAWETAVGLHRNDSGPLPPMSVSVCPGLLGGVETPAAVSAGRVFVPVVDLCYRENATGGAAASFQRLDPARGAGRLVALDLATGRRLWAEPLPSPDFGCATVVHDVVFTSTYAGFVYALASRDGRRLWSARLPAGINACPSVAGTRLYVAAGVPTHRGGALELVAFDVMR
jgi:alcohol dehydrogenase (cytochrome c)